MAIFDESRRCNLEALAARRRRRQPARLLSVPQELPVFYGPRFLICGPRLLICKGMYICIVLVLDISKIHQNDRGNSSSLYVWPEGFTAGGWCAQGAWSSYESHDGFERVLSRLDLISFLGLLWFSG